MDNRTITDQQQLLAELARTGSQNRQEPSIVVSPGGRAAAWAIIVKSHVDYNTYNVRAVVLSDAGAMPMEIGAQMEATNLAESFLSQGALAAGTYALMCRIGESNVFYAMP